MARNYEMLSMKIRFRLTASRKRPFQPASFLFRQYRNRGRGVNMLYNCGYSCSPPIRRYCCQRLGRYSICQGKMFYRIVQTPSEPFDFCLIGIFTCGGDLIGALASLYSNFSDIVLLFKFSKNGVEGGGTNPDSPPGPCLGIDTSCIDYHSMILFNDIIKRYKRDDKKKQIRTKRILQLQI